MATSEEEMLKTLQELSTAMTNISDRMNEQAKDLATLKRTKAQAQPQDPVDPDHVARLAAHAVHQSLAPEIAKIVDAMRELNGTKAMLRERWRVVDREEARLGRWLFLPLTVTVGVPLVLAIVLAVTIPRAVAYTPFTCRMTGGTWYEPSERLLSACSYTSDERASAD